MDNNTRLKNWFPLIGAILLVGGMWIGYLLADGDRLTPAQKKLNDIFALIADDYVDEISEDSLIEMAIPDILRNLDPHSTYFPQSELESANRDLESSFYGVGVQFQIMNDTVCVVEVVAGGPAERVGLQAGDRIIEVDGKKLTGSKITNEDVFTTLRGAKDTEVTVKVKRSTSSKPLSFTIVRGEIPSVSVDGNYLINDSTGYIRINKFAANTHQEMIQALNSLRVRGAGNIIVDLRGNTGGLLDQAVLISNEWLPYASKIVEIRGRHEDENAVWVADGTGMFNDMQLVVLVDEFSASSSEIVAGAIQDNDRGLIIGRRTFGKGLVQRAITLPDSSQMRLTVQRYYTPSGRCIQKDFVRGDNDSYQTEIFDRYSNGEVFSADSIKVDQSKVFTTMMGRTVYGGGGIIPDVFVPSDTSNVTSYYINVANAGLLNRFAYEYADLNRDELTRARNVDELLAMLPPADILLRAFTRYASQNGVPQRWYYINISAPLIVNQLRALIARDILGFNAYFEITNLTDPMIKEALRNFDIGIESVISRQIENNPAKK